jgi:large subunit ribosomal protein L24e
MTLTRCIFCGRQEEDYKGTYLIKNEGTQAYYCSSKCRKNHLKLGRDGRRVRWTKSFREERVRKAAAESHAQRKADLDVSVPIKSKPVHKKQ